MASALDILQALSPDKSLVGGIVEVAELRRIAPIDEYRQLTGQAPDVLAAEERESEGLIDDPTFLSGVEAFGKAVTGFFTAGVAPALVSLAEEAGHDSVDQGDLLKTGGRLATSYLTQGVDMSAFDLFSGFDTIDGGGFTDFFGDIFTSENLGSLVQAGLPLAQSALVNALAPNQVIQGSSAGSLAQLPRGAAVGAMALPAVMGVGRRLFNRFPNLATSLQRWRTQGIQMTQSKAWSLMKRFGPEFLVSGGILTAAAVSELAVAGSGRRRMNPANVRALRRSCRRVEGFHKLCTRVDLLRARGRRSAPNPFRRKKKC